MTNPLLGALVDHADPHTLAGHIDDMSPDVLHRWVTRACGQRDAHQLVDPTRLRHATPQTQLTAAHHLATVAELTAFVDVEQPELLHNYLHAVGDRWDLLRHDLFAHLVDHSPTNDIVAFLAVADGHPVVPRRVSPGPAPRWVQELIDDRLVADAQADPRVATWAQLERLSVAAPDTALAALAAVTGSPEQHSTIRPIPRTVELAVTTYATRAAPADLASLLAALSAVDGHSVYRQLDTLHTTLAEHLVGIAVAQGRILAQRIADSCFGADGLAELERCSSPTARPDDLTRVHRDEGGWLSRRVARACIVTLAANPHVDLAALVAARRCDDTDFALLDVGVARRPGVTTSDLIAHASSRSRSYGDLPTHQLSTLCRITSPEQLDATIVAWVTGPDTVSTDHERLHTVEQAGLLTDTAIASLPVETIRAQLPDAVGRRVARWLEQHLGPSDLRLAGQLAGQLTLGELTDQTRAVHA